VLHEQKWLPVVSAALPLPTPVPVRVGRPTTDFPWSWSIVPWFEGVPADRRPPLDAEVAAAQLGGFLRALHRRAPTEAPRNPYRGVPLDARADLFETRLGALASEVDGTSVRAVWERAVAAPRWTRAPVWLHGDLHPANTLVAHGRLAAVIDFGDVCAGDPATDLAAAWMLLPPAAVPVFAGAYGDMDADLVARALGWAALFGLMLLAIGLDDRPTYEPIGRRTLEHAVQHRVAS
jgi:aminoglycoside phosphotransferase (APT) family kinase protein